MTLKKPKTHRVRSFLKASATSDDDSAAQQAATLRSGFTISDMLEERYAMDAKCCTEESHPNNCWSPLRHEEREGEKVSTKTQ